MYFQELPQPEHSCFIKCSCLPVNQTGLPHSQVSHNNHFRDFKPDKRRKSKNQYSVLNQPPPPNLSSPSCPHPTVPVRFSWQAVFTLLLKSSFVCKAASFLKHWKRGRRTCENRHQLSQLSLSSVSVRSPEGAGRWCGPFGREVGRSWLGFGQAPWSFGGSAAGNKKTQSKAERQALHSRKSYSFHSWFFWRHHWFGAKLATSYVICVKYDHELSYFLMASKGDWSSCLIQQLIFLALHPTLTLLPWIWE